MQKIIWLSFSIVLLVILISCGRFLSLKKEAERLEMSYYLTGELDAGSKTTKSVWVFVVEKQDTGIITITDVDRLRSGGTFVFMLPPSNRYYVGALEDSNDNQHYDPGERLWIHGDPGPVKFTNGKSSMLKIRLSKKVTISEEDQFALSKARAGRSYLSLKDGRQVPVFIGETADLGDPKFSAENGKKGLWEPASFLNEAGIGVYFLSKYDPGKIPVLFVYGAGGSPENWEYIFKKLDDRKYQKWFYHYPSGMRLEQTSRSLNYIIQSLHKKYRFSELYVVGYSMGGLISRSFIIKNRIEAGNSYIKKFVSISSSWGGHEAAALGVKHAPASIPSWHDMQMNSPFIEDLFSRNIGDKVDYYLIFGFHGKNVLFLPASNDGNVSMASQLDLRAQREAKMIFGFDKNHKSILADDSVLETIESILMR
jgi:pimeloyl-ACP methyl ester carboxylesterase